MKITHDQDIIKLLFVLLIVLLFSCHYDPYPPSEEELTNKDKILRIYLTGFTPRKNVYIEYKDFNGNYNIEDPLYISEAGSFHASLYLDSQTITYDIKISIDENNDGSIGSTDYQLDLSNQDATNKEIYLSKSMGDFSVL